MCHCVDALSYKVKPLWHSLKVEGLEFGDVLDGEFMTPNQLLAGNAELLETSNNSDTFAKMFPVSEGDYILEKGRRCIEGIPRLCIRWRFFLRDF